MNEREFLKGADPPFTRFPNYILDVFPRLRLNRREKDILLVFIRLIIGFHRRSKKLSLTVLAEKTCIDPSDICRSAASLIRKGFILCNPGLGTRASVYSISSKKFWDDLAKHPSQLVKTPTLRGQNAQTIHRDLKKSFKEKPERNQPFELKTKTDNNKDTLDEEVAKEILDRMERIQGINDREAYFQRAYSQEKWSRAETRIEREAQENKVRFAEEARSACSDPDLSKLLSQIMKPAKKI